MENTKLGTSHLSFVSGRTTVQGKPQGAYCTSDYNLWYPWTSKHSFSSIAGKKKLFQKGRSNDLISDSITRIKNGYSRRFDQVTLSHSKEILQLLEAFLQAGYIQNYTLVPSGPLTNVGFQPDKHSSVAQVTKQSFSNTCLFGTTSGWSPTNTINVSLKYYQSLPAIKGIQRLSKPNKRLYFSKKKIVEVSQEQNWGENWTLFLSTSKGIIDHRQALDFEGIGGEGLCLVW